MSEFERFLAQMAGAARAQRQFKTPYEAGVDARVNGPNPANCHFCWFACKEDTAEWERGNRAQDNS